MTERWGARAQSNQRMPGPSPQGAATDKLRRPPVTTGSWRGARGRVLTVRRDYGQGQDSTLPRRSRPEGRR
jgi:hypothetical protein